MDEIPDIPARDLMGELLASLEGERVLYDSSRGFKQGHQIPSEYGGMIRSYESSAAEGPHVWIRIECPIDLNDPHGPMRDAVVHLTLKNAVRFRDQLGQLTTEMENDWGIETHDD